MKMFKKLLCIILCICFVTVLQSVPSAATETQRRYGDVDNDGNVNSADALNILKIATGMQQSDDDDYKYGDCDVTASLIQPMRL